MESNNISDIDAYIAGFPEATQVKLQQIRAVIKAAAPESEETISYQMPTFKLGKNLVHFAGYKKHIGFYPTPSGIAAFQEELSIYPNAKGSVQFPLDQPLPLELITKIVVFRVAENTKSKKVKPAKKS
ncbi:MAG: DUF1801 domain-containing protein [Bacteroidota bacterium]